MSSDEQDEETKAISETKTAVFPHVLFLFSTSSRCFEADKVANFFLSFFYVQRKHIILLYEKAARSLALFSKKKKKLLE